MGETALRVLNHFGKGLDVLYGRVSCLSVLLAESGDYPDPVNRFLQLSLSLQRNIVALSCSLDLRLKPCLTFVTLYRLCFYLTVNPLANIFT